MKKWPLNIYLLSLLMMFLLVGCSDSDNSGVLFIAANQPSQVSSITVTPADTQLTVTWAAGTRATAYKVYYNTTNNSSTATEFTGDSNTADTTCIITGLTDGTAYYVWVKSINSLGSSDFSAASSPGTPVAAATVPAIPALLAVTAGDTQLSVTWAAAAGATSYKVYFNTANNSSTATEFTGDSNAADTTCLITGLTNGTAYYVWIKAVNSLGSSAFSSASSPGTPAASVTVPAVPLSPAVTAGDTQLSVTWVAATGATSYKVYYNTVNNSSTAAEFTGDSNTADTSCIITGLTNGTPYYVWVKAINSAGSSDFSSASSPSTPAPPTNTALFNNPIAVTTDGTSLYVVDYGNQIIRKIVTATGFTTTLAGTAGQNGTTDGTGAAARFKDPQGGAVIGTNLYIADTNNNLIRKIVIATGEVTTLAGIADGFSVSLDGTGTAARFAGPIGICTDGTDLYVTDSLSNKIRKVTTAGVVSTIAGAASFNMPLGITTDGTNLYVADGNNYQIRKIVIATEAVTTLAGSGSSGSADNANGLLASFSQVYGITHDGTNLYVSDTVNQTIRMIAMGTGATTTLAGSAGLIGSTDGTGAAARFRGPKGITQVGGNLYLADFVNHTIRKIVIATGAVTTFAGTAGTSGSTN